MMPIDKMGELIERVERASGASAELDCAIRLAVYAPEGATMEQSRINGAWCIYSGIGFRSGKPALWESNEGRNQDFTASIDAAMTLKPDGWFISGASEQEDGRFCFALFPRRPDDLGVPRTFEAHSALVARVVAATPALALCAAALKARVSASTIGEG